VTYPGGQPGRIMEGMGRWQTVGAVLLIVGVMGLVACTTSRDGTVTGTAAPCEGLASQAEYAQLPVLVTLRHGQLVIASDVIHGRATYSLTAPPGSYLLASDQIPTAVHVRLMAAKTVRVDLIPVCKSVLPPGGSTTTTVISPSNLMACRASQLQIQLEGIQGAAGNWAATFWVADTSAIACALQSPVELDLLNSAGEVQLTATKTYMSIALTADTSMPSDNTVSSGQLAYVILFWPTDADTPGAVDGHCATPDFIPATTRFTFGDSGPIDVSNNGQIAICGKFISILNIGILSPS